MWSLGTVLGTSARVVGVFYYRAIFSILESSPLIILKIVICAWLCARVRACVRTCEGMHILWHSCGDWNLVFETVSFACCWAVCPRLAALWASWGFPGPVFHLLECWENWLDQPHPCTCLVEFKHRLASLHGKHFYPTSAPSLTFSIRFHSSFVWPFVLSLREKYKKAKQPAWNSNYQLKYRTLV